MVQIWTQYFPYKRGFVTLNKSVINFLPRCSFSLLQNEEKEKREDVSPRLD